MNDQIESAVDVQSIGEQQVADVKSAALALKDANLYSRSERWGLLSTLMEAACGKDLRGAGDGWDRPSYGRADWSKIEELSHDLAVQMISLRESPKVALKQAFFQAREILDAANWIN